VESIYRRSTKAVYHVVDLEDGTALELMGGDKISYATLSPDNTKVAFVKDNDIFYTDLANNEIHQVTHDGKKNHIINGAADWVYEEEFSMAKAFEWSPDGKKIAFIRFDESEVPEFNDAVLAIHNSLEDHDDDGAYPDTEGEPSAVPWPA
jgi:dipeptidyl-peptidase 4